MSNAQELEIRTFIRDIESLREDRNRTLVTLREIVKGNVVEGWLGEQMSLILAPALTRLAELEAAESERAARKTKYMERMDRMRSAPPAPLSDEELQWMDAPMGPKLTKEGL